MKAEFTASQFVPTQWETAEQKAKFANQFVRFVTGGMKYTLFPKWFYQRLCGMFGHIAHTSQRGFYGYWFSNRADATAFCNNVEDWVAYGDPTYTYSDVERALSQWMINHPHRVIYGS